MTWIIKQTQLSVNTDTNPCTHIVVEAQKDMPGKTKSYLYRNIQSHTRESKIDYYLYFCIKQFILT